MASMAATQAAGGFIAAPGTVQPTAKAASVAPTQATSPVINTQGLTADAIRQNVANFTAPKTQAGTAVISPESLSSTQAVKIPETPVSTTATGILGTTGAIKDAGLSTQQAKLEQDKANAQATQTADRAALTQTMNDILGIQTGSEQARQDAGIDVKTQKVNEYTSQLDSLQRRQQNEIRSLEGTSLTDSQKAAKINEINRASAFEQADVAVLQSAANRDLATAQTILDSKTKLALEPLQTKLQFQQFFYQENKDILTKAEDRAFQNAIRESDRKYQEEKTKLDNINALRLQAVKDGNYELAQKLGSVSSEDEAYKVYTSSYGGNVPVKPLINPDTGKQDPLGQITSIVSTSKAKDNTKIQDVIGVISATQQLASKAQPGSLDFAGVGPLAQNLPGFLVGQTGTDIRTALNAINLKTQQWASGASLTKEQIDMVDQMVPKAGDSDGTMQRKINSLTNFMMSQAQGLLASQGIRYSPETVDLFRDVSRMSNDELISSVSKLSNNSDFFNTLTAGSTSKTIK
jgi:hypothetical protein